MSQEINRETTLDVYVKIKWNQKWDYTLQMNVWTPEVITSTGSTPPSISDTQSVIKMELTIPEGFYESRFPVVKATAPFREVTEGVGVVPPDVHVAFPE